MSIRTFARISILSAAALAGAGAANADVFLKVEGAPGEASLRGFEGQIAVSGASMNISSFAMPDP
jgi:type VI protein secretion system component Hcp